MNDNPPSTLSYEHYGIKISITNPNSDLCIEEFFDNCRSLARAAGYGEKNIKEWFDE